MENETIVLRQHTSEICLPKNYLNRTMFDQIIASSRGGGVALFIIFVEYVGIGIIMLCCHFSADVEAMCSSERSSSFDLQCFFSNQLPDSFRRPKKKSPSKSRAL